jgi:predicted aconitase
MLNGEAGPGPQMAMELLTAVAPATRATELIDIVGAHIGGCLYHGVAGLDFARELADRGARAAVPTTLNVSSIDLIHPGLYRGPEEEARAARELMDAYVAMGCSPTWTCAPYQLSVRPALGDQVAWGESNAIVFANSVLGARTNRYGDFLDICCAVTGRAPASGMHTDEGRRATLHLEVRIPDRLLDEELLYPLLGHVLGQEAGTEVAVISGLDGRADEDRLKALGAAAASSGAVAMFHVVGVTPEAATLTEAAGGNALLRTVVVDVDRLTSARSSLDVGTGDLTAVSVGTPHISIRELETLAALVTSGRSKVPFYVNVGRDVLDEASSRQLVEPITRFGATLVTDTCTYITPIMEDLSGVVMTNSGKWAYYAPGNIGVRVVMGSMSECVQSAISGLVATGEPW